MGGVVMTDAVMIKLLLLLPLGDDHVGAVVHNIVILRRRLRLNVYISGAYCLVVGGRRVPGARAA